MSGVKKVKKKKTLGIFHAAVNNATEAVYGFVKKSFIGKFFRSGDKLSALVSESLILSLLLRTRTYIREKLKRRPKKVIGTEEFGRSVGIYNEASFRHPLKNRIIGSVENSVVVGAFRSLAWKFVTLPMMSVGIFFMALGISVTATQAITLFLSDNPVSEILTLGQGIIVLLFSLPALTTRDESVYNCMRESLFGRFIMFSVMGCSREKPQTEKSENQFGFVLFCLGFLLGLLSFRFSVLSIFLIILVAICTVRIFIVPEFGILVLMFFAPLFSLAENPPLLCSVTVLYISICFFIKAVVGKRSVKFTFLDFWVLLFAILMLSSAQSARLFGDSLSASLINVSFILGYFVIKNTVRSKKWFDRCINAFLASSLYVAVIALSQAITNLSMHNQSVFNSEHTLAWYMTAAFIVSMSKALSVPRYRFLYFSLMVINLAALFASGSIFAALILSATVVVFFMVYSHRTVAVILLLILLIPVVSCLVSGSEVSSFISYVTYSDVSQSYKVGVWSVSLKMIKDHLWFGIGMGEEVFRSVFSSYTSSEMQIPNNSMSLLLQLILQIGLFGLLFFAAVIIILSIQTFTVYCKAGADKESRTCTLGLFFAIAALSVGGIFVYVWEEAAISLTFWTLLGLTEAVRQMAENSAKQEYDYLESISSDITIDFLGA